MLTGRVKERENVKQYCRYCANANWYDDSVYCHIRNTLISKSTACKTNNCKSFEFNELDVFDIEKKYKPRTEPRTEKINDGQQINLTEVTE